MQVTLPDRDPEIPGILRSHVATTLRKDLKYKPFG